MDEVAMQQIAPVLALGSFPTKHFLVPPYTNSTMQALCCRGTGFQDLYYISKEYTYIWRCNTYMQIYSSFQNLYCLDPPFYSHPLLGTLTNKSWSWRRPLKKAIAGGPPHPTPSMSKIGIWKGWPFCKTFIFLLKSLHLTTFWVKRDLDSRKGIWKGWVCSKFSVKFSNRSTRITRRQNYEIRIFKRGHSKFCLGCSNICIYAVHSSICIYIYTYGLMTPWLRGYKRGHSKFCLGCSNICIYAVHSSICIYIYIHIFSWRHDYEDIKGGILNFA